MRPVSARPAEPTLGSVMPSSALADLHDLRQVRVAVAAILRSGGPLQIDRLSAGDELRFDFDRLGRSGRQRRRSRPCRDRFAAASCSSDTPGPIRLASCTFVGQYTVAWAQSASACADGGAAAHVLFAGAGIGHFFGFVGKGHRLGDIQIAARLIGQGGQQVGRRFAGRSRSC